MRTVLVIEDDPHISRFIQYGLTLKGFKVLTAATGLAGIKLVLEYTPDLLLLDIMLPDIDGFEVCQRLRKQEQQTLPIIMLTSRDEREATISGLNSGADDYMTKPFDFDELLARMHAVLRRAAQASQLTNTITIGDLEINTTTHEVFLSHKAIDFTPREYSLLELLAQNAGRTVTKERIFERIWGYDSDTNIDVIKVYITYIRNKLNTSGKCDLIQAVRGVGYMLKT